MESVGLISTSTDSHNRQLRSILKESFSDSQKRLSKEQGTINFQNDEEVKKLMIESLKSFFLELSVSQIEAMSSNFISAFVSSSPMRTPEKFGADPVQGFDDISARRKNRKERNLKKDDGVQSARQPIYPKTARAEDKKSFRFDALPPSSERPPVVEFHGQPANMQMHAPQPAKKVYNPKRDPIPRYMSPTKNVIHKHEDTVMNVKDSGYVNIQDQLRKTSSPARTCR
mmetsp:Transcript_33053/g.50678  ORF Transcript_33053/g.50678 Transcript_33053/m.50678 type:complete len:228 (+) Transcript_33053:247-930(+)